MSKSQQNQTYNSANNQQTVNNQNEAAANTELQGVLGTAQANAASVMPGVVSGYQDIQSTGGYDPSVTGNINSTYDSLMTGGLSPDQIGAMKQEASQAAQSTYQTAQDEAKREQAATGGYGVSGSIIGDLASKGSQAASSATNNTIANIAQLQAQNEATGAAGASQVQQNIAGNKLAATGGLTNIYGMNESQVSQTISQILQNYQQTGQMNAQDMAIMTNLANQPGVFDKIVGTIGTLGGAAAGVMTGIGAVNKSDMRTKEDVTHFGEFDGLPVIGFKYKGEEGYHIGTSAQAVEKRYPEAILEDKKKIKYIDYSKLNKSIIGNMEAA